MHEALLHILMRYSNRGVTAFLESPQNELAVYSLTMLYSMIPCI